MNYKNDGLTVGELTIAVGGVIVIFLIWSGINKNQDSTNGFHPQNDFELVTQRVWQC
tara:strand:+ start:331 stop:501 length:171 start_codon:yes stop_codon:yes gene_type:complete